MIERHITFSVNPGSEAAFERLFTGEYRPAAQKMPGLLALSLLREAEQASRYQMVFRWTDAESAVAWRVSDAHQALQPALNALHDGMEIVAYAVVAA